MKSVFEFNEVLPFLLDRLGSRNQRKGLKSALARHIGCQTSYLSQILSDSVKLSVEQAIEAADFFQLSELATDYFLLLVQKERAGTQKARAYLEEKISLVLQEKNNLSKRLKDESESITKEAQNKYYSDWAYLAVHILTSVPGFSKAVDIGPHLGLSLSKTEQILQFLAQHDFVRESLGRYSIGSRHIHLEKSNPLNLNHQLNWRLKALEKVKSKDLSEINYAGVYSLSKKDADQIKENLLKVIKANLKVVAPSKEEVVYCSVIDFFEV